jgi:ATP-dependent Clp protease ATP-binding subunit ClpA
VFHPLDQANIASIARIQLKALEERLRKLEIRLDITDAALKVVAQAGFDPVYGARPLKRAIQQQIENPLAKEILGAVSGPAMQFTCAKRAARSFSRKRNVDGLAFDGSRGCVRRRAVRHARWACAPREPTAVLTGE